GDPARFERVSCISSRADLYDAEIFPGFQDGGADFIAFRIGAPHFEARRTGHAVAQHANLATGDRHIAHVKELDVWERAAVDFPDDILRLRTLDRKSTRLNSSH